VKVCTEVALLAFGLVHLICRATGDVRSLDGMISYVVEKIQRHDKILVLIGNVAVQSQYVCTRHQCNSNDIKH
jgi:hypothetical protein